MIVAFQERETRESGVIYNSTLNQIKKLYQMDKELAGEFAMSAIELVLTGEISSDNPMIEIMLEATKVVNEKNKNKWEKRVENQKQHRKEELRLEEVAELAKQKLTQAAIGKKLGLSQQNISSRLRIIRDEYPELLQPKVDFTNDTNNTNNTTYDTDTDTDTVTDKSVRGVETPHPMAIGGKPPLTNQFKF